ncbi:MAG: PAS domain S-box protein [Desulfobacter sp.]|nr:PAS domain S-box protein [Desulfobacter sp.]
MSITPPSKLLCENIQGKDGLGSPFFQMMMDNAPDLIWAKDMDDNYIFVNKATCHILLKCTSASKALGQNDIYFAARENNRGYLHTFGEICVNSDQVVKKSGKPGRFIEEGFVRGAYLILDVSKAPFYDDQGQMIGTVGSARDITAEREIETKLKISEERFRQMADFLPLPIAEFDFEFHLFYANRAGLDYFGYTRADYERYPSISHLVPQDKLDLLSSWFEDIKQGNECFPFEMGFIKKDGSAIYGVVNAAPIMEEGRAIAVRVCFTDLSARRDAEIALQENENRFRTLFNVFNDPVFVHPFAEEGFLNFVEVNEVACQWYGYTRKELLNLSPQDLILDPVGKGMGSAESRINLMNAKKRTIQTLNKKKNNEIFPAEISSSVFDYKGEKMILSTVRDITDRRQSEKERADALKFAAEQEKYALVGQVAGKMAHDFNNILGGIMGNAELSLMDCKDPEIKNTLRLILDQTFRGKNMTKNLVAFARDQEPKEAFFNLNEKLDLVLSLMKKELKRVRVVRKFAVDLPDFLADPGMIEHALVNLIQNAVHAMGKNPNPELKICTAHLADCLVIEIQDNGCGIPAQYHDQIYAPSFTLKGSKDIFGQYSKEIRGTGYGMSNVKKYIQKHRGSICFTSDQQTGTCFKIAIPLVNKTLTQKEKIRMARKQVIQNKKILLVEDEPAISGVQKKILSQAPFHHKVTLASMGQDAIEAFDKENFDLVSLDYLLPGRLNGMDVYSHIRRTDTKVPVVFFSGNIGFLESMKELGTKDPMMDHLSKPCENIVFADTVNEWLFKAGAGF